MSDRMIEYGATITFHREKILVLATLLTFNFLLFTSLPTDASSQSKTETLQADFQSAIQKLKKQDDAENFIYAFLDFYLADPTEKRLTFFDQYEKEIWRPLQTKEEHLAYVILLCNKGYYLSQSGEIYPALDAYEKAWKIYTNNSLAGFDIIEYCLKPLGNNYSMLGDYNSAGNIVRHYLFMAEKERNYPHVVSGLINLSIIYQVTSRHSEAIDLLNSALNAKVLSEEKKAIVFSHLAKNYLTLGNLSKAQNYALATISYFTNHQSSDGIVHFVSAYTVLSLISLQNKDSDKALKYIKIAQALALEKSASFKAREIAKLINQYAEILKIKNQDLEALKQYQQALMRLLPQYSPVKTEDLPDKPGLYAENTIKESLDGMAEVYLKINALEKALECYELSFTVEDLLRETFNYQDAKLDQQLENRLRAGQAIELLYQLYQVSKDQRYMNRAFRIAERTKALVLKETIASNQWKQSLRDEDNLLKKESALAFKMATLSNEIILEQMKEGKANIENINHLTALQTEVSIEIKALKKAIAKKYPDKYFKNTDGVDLKKLQKKLIGEKAIIIEYFAGNNALYVFSIDQASLSFIKIENIEIVNENIKVLNALFASPSAINNDVNSYKKVALKLYQILKIPKNEDIENLIIIPDGLLNYIPFDALLTQQTSSLDYSSFPYLLKQYKIAYQSSADIYLNFDKVNDKTERKNLLAIFPLFENSNRALKHSKVEAENIQSYIEGTYKYKEQATKRYFQEHAGDYSIIHLSTHAASGPFLEPPSVDFIDSTMYLPEVYGLQIKPDLMILSACETGVGKLLKGEGALSIARGFQYAGVKNIIFSLWKVNDYSTAILMSDFYHHYSETFTGIDALHKAKLNYLTDIEIKNSHKSPYFWAAFVYYGDLQSHPLKSNPFSWIYVILIGAVGIAVVGRTLIILSKA